MSLSICHTSIYFKFKNTLEQSKTNTWHRVFRNFTVYIFPFRSWTKAFDCPQKFHSLSSFIDFSCIRALGRRERRVPFKIMNGILLWNIFQRIAMKWIGAEVVKNWLFKWFFNDVVNCVEFYINLRDKYIICTYSREG